MVDLTKSFVMCGHCRKQLASPMYVCPWCNWPREHTDITPPPEVGLPDNSFTRETIKVKAAPQQGQTAIPPPAEFVEITLAPISPPQAPAMNEATLPEVDLTGVPKADPTPRTIVLADDPEPAPAAPPAAAAPADDDSIAGILASLNYEPKPITRKKKS